MLARACSTVLLVCAIATATVVPAIAQSAPASTTVSGRILEITHGLPIVGATVKLRHDDTTIATAKTGPDGSFFIRRVAPGNYQVLIEAGGYQTTLLEGLVVAEGQQDVALQTALSPLKGGLKTIYTTSVASRAALQTSATINNSIAPSLITNQNFQRAGDALGTLPFVTASTSGSLGDDESLSIRGFDPTETATLLDGHPIGPIGATGGGFDYQLAQFWGYGNINVVYGSGATGLYGVPTIAGAVDFQTLDPTQQQHFSFTQGYGDLGHELTGLTFTGTSGRVGYAFAYGVEGTDGELGPQNIEQTGLLGEGADASGCPGSDNTNGLPTLRSQDVKNCDYLVSGAYVNRNVLGKVTYQLDSKTSILATAYNSSMYADSTGNGDEDYLSPQYVLQTHPSGVNDSETLPNGATASCANSYVVLNDSRGGYECLNSKQFAAAFSGPQGGGLGRFHAGIDQDYHTRITRKIGAGTLTLDGFVDNYGYINTKGPGDAPNHDDTYLTHGGLLSDEYAGSRNDFSFGVYFQKQLHETNSNMYNANTIGGPFEGFQLADTIYSVKDTYVPNDRLSFFADAAVDRNKNTNTSNFDPRLSIVYRPTNNDVLRATAGRSTSIPDPALLYSGSSFSMVTSSFNATQGCHSLTAIGSTSSQYVQPERDNDLEFAVAHRFDNQATLELDAYDSIETNPIVGGTFPLSILSPQQLAAALPYEAGYITQLEGGCGGTFTAANLGVSSTFNAGQAVYRGINLDTSVPLTRQLKINGGFTVQSAYYTGLNVNILSNNTGFINGSQFGGVPLHQARVGLAYDNRAGAVTAALNEYYVGYPNPYDGAPYWYANGNLTKTVGPITFNFGIYNIFNSDASKYGLIGLGLAQPQNQFGIAQGNATAFAQGAELYGLPPRQLWFTTTFHF